MLPTKKKQRRFIRRTLMSCAWLASALAVERFTHWATDGFTLYRIQSPLSYNPLFEARSLTVAEKESYFNQPYRYLGCGSQSFAFESADGRYILKFFKHHRFRSPLALTWLPLPSPLKERREHHLSKKTESLKETLESCLFSDLRFHKETGMLYTHLTKSHNLDTTVTLIDRLNIQHKVDLDQYEFLIQKKAVTVPDFLLTLRAKGDHERAKIAFDQVLELTERRALMGYRDKVPNLIRNFGFVDGQAVEIDVGGFAPMPNTAQRFFYQKDIHKIKTKFLPWFEAYYPEIAPYVATQMESLMD